VWLGVQHRHRINVYCLLQHLLFAAVLFLFFYLLSKHCVARNRPHTWSAFGSASFQICFPYRKGDRGEDRCLVTEKNFFEMRYLACHFCLTTNWGVLDDTMDLHFLMFSFSSMRYDNPVHDCATIVGGALSKMASRRHSLSLC